MTDLKLVLERQSDSDQATIGVLFDPRSEWELFTLENPPRATTVDARIPAGRYKCRRVDSPKFGDTFEVCNVPGRTHILFHAGNTEGDTTGCILLGMTRTSETSIGRSQEAFARFLEHTFDVDEFDFEIVDV